jgi:hypothetical protein
MGYVIGIPGYLAASFRVGPDLYIGTGRAYGCAALIKQF